MDISFQQVKDALTGEISTTQILYINEQGERWFTPLGAGHRFEDIYNEWCAAGNKALPPE